MGENNCSCDRRVTNWNGWPEAPAKTILQQIHVGAQCDAEEDEEDQFSEESDDEEEFTDEE